MVTYHGGGWCIGELQGEESLCRSVSSKLGVTCVNVDYRLAPENMFPIGVNDAFDATKWVSKCTALVSGGKAKNTLGC